MRKPVRGRPACGFTLVEVLVALLIMAILASLAWQGLDSVLRARDGSRAAIDKTVRLATVLTQWEQDLQSLYIVDMAPGVPALAFDGQTLRLTRRVETGVQLVAWSVRGGTWQRWTAPPTTRGGELQQNWLRSQQLLGNEAGVLTLAEGASQWQVYFNRGGQWTNAQSTGDLAQPVAAVVPQPVPAAPASGASGVAGGSAAGGTAPLPVVANREVLPDAVRLVITLNGQTLTRDIAVGPSGS